MNCTNSFPSRLISDETVVVHIFKRSFRLPNAFQPGLWNDRNPCRQSDFWLFWHRRYFPEVYGNKKAVGTVLRKVTQGWFAGGGHDPYSHHIWPVLTILNRKIWRLCHRYSFSIRRFPCCAKNCSFASEVMEAKSSLLLRESIFFPKGCLWVAVHFENRLSGFLSSRIR